MLGENESKLKDLESLWISRCQEIEQIELSSNRVRIIKDEFEIDRLTFMANLTQFDMPEYNTRMEKIGWAVDHALDKANSKFKDKEAKRLKKMWGPLAGIAYLIKLKFGML